MTVGRRAGVIVDTMVISWLFDERLNPLADDYRALIGEVPVLLAFQTVMELRYGAPRAGWGELRRRRLERRVAELRQACRRIGHPLSSKIHDGDRWIAAAAIRLGLPLVSHDAVFKAAPQLLLLTATPDE